MQQNVDNSFAESLKNDGWNPIPILNPACLGSFSPEMYLLTVWLLTARCRCCPLAALSWRLQAGRKSVFTNRTNKRRTFKRKFDEFIYLHWKKSSKKQRRLGLRLHVQLLLHTFNHKIFLSSAWPLPGDTLLYLLFDYVGVLKDIWVQLNSPRGFFLCRWAVAVTRQLPFALATFVFLMSPAFRGCNVVYPQIPHTHSSPPQLRRCTFDQYTCRATLSQGGLFSLLPSPPVCDWLHSCKAELLGFSDTANIYNAYERRTKDGFWFLPQIYEAF